METPNTCGLSPASGYSPVLVVSCCCLCQRVMWPVLREPCSVDECRDLFDEYRGLFEGSCVLLMSAVTFWWVQWLDWREPWPVKEVPWPCEDCCCLYQEVPWPCEGCRCPFWKGPLLFAGCQGYLLSETPLICCCLFPTVFGCELGFLVVGVFGFPLVLTVVAWKIYQSVARDLV